MHGLAIISRLLACRYPAERTTQLVTGDENYLFLVLKLGKSELRTARGVRRRFHSRPAHH